MREVHLGEFSAALMEYAKQNKRDASESTVSAFSRILESDRDIRTAYGIAKGYASLEPTSVEVGDTGLTMTQKQGAHAF
jgi:hypothetical protein